MNTFSSGNITIAILYWLLSVKQIKNDKLTLSPAFEFDFSFLQQMHIEDLLTFAALLQHETLSAIEHSQVFRQDLQKSQLSLNRLMNKGILVKTEEGYKIHYFLYRPIVRILLNKNIMN